MNTPTPTPRTDTEITFTGTYTCTHHNDAERTACPVCLINAITAERDQLRAENATLRAAQKACEACDEPTAFEVRKLSARAECAEAELATERARLDWLAESWDNPLAINLHPSYGWSAASKNLRAVIDVAMKGRAK